MADSPNKSSLNKLYNSQVTHAEHVKRPLGTTPSGSKRLHEGVKVTLKSGDQYLVHKGPNFGKSSDTVVTPASNMKPGNWQTVASSDVRGKTVNDFVKHANPGTPYCLWKLDHCQAAARNTWDQNVGRP